MIKLTDILKQVLQEEKTKRDRCLRIADRKFDKPSAYKSGAVVRCRKGNIWKGLKEEVPQSGESSGSPAKFKPGAEPEKTEFLTLSQILQQVKGIPYYKEVLDDMKKGDESWGVTKKVKEYAEYMKENPSSLENLPPIIVIDGSIQDGAHRISAIYLLQNLLDQKNNYWKTVKLKVEFWNKSNLNEDESLRKWFKRSGPKGKEGGWVDCNTCKDGSCKACGRKKGEKRSKYPSCRPTPAQCKDKGKGKKWGKTK
jgi:hypothetical protein